jgi:hypothetical protein
MSPRSRRCRGDVDVLFIGLLCRIGRSIRHPIGWGECEANGASPHAILRERMGIEPTRGLSPDPSLVLKTRGGTNRPNAPRGVEGRQDTTLSDGTRSFNGSTCIEV